MFRCISGPFFRGKEYCAHVIHVISTYPFLGFEAKLHKNIGSFMGPPKEVEEFELDKDAEASCFV